MPVPVTALYSGLLALVVLLLAYNVSRVRRQEKIGLGDENNRNMRVAMRIHGNAIEILPIAVLLMLVYEANGGSAWFLHACGVLFVLGRLMHYHGLMQHTGRSFGRYWGTAITWLPVAALAGLNILSFLGN